MKLMCILYVSAPQHCYSLYNKIQVQLVFLCSIYSLSFNTVQVIQFYLILTRCACMALPSMLQPS